MEKDRLKASDVYNNTNYIFSKKVSFNEAYPMIEDITVKVEEYNSFSLMPDNSRGLYPHKRFYNITNPPGEFVNCSNTICYNGGFALGDILREMVSKKETVREDTAGCQGYEGSPKGRRRYRSCIHRFDYKIIIKYNEKT